MVVGVVEPQRSQPLCIPIRQFDPRQICQVVPNKFVAPITLTVTKSVTNKILQTNPLSDKVTDSSINKVNNNIFIMFEMQGLWQGDTSMVKDSYIIIDKRSLIFRNLGGQI